MSARIACIAFVLLLSRVFELRLDAEEPAAASIADWSSLIEDLAIHLIPENYSDDRHWGKTEKIASGVRVRTKGGQVRFEQREKKVNNGFWRRVKIRLLKPDETFHLEIRNSRTLEDGSTRFDLFVQVRARCETQFAWWAWGVKGLNGSMESDVTLQMLADCSFVIQSESKDGEFFPTYALRPQIHDLDLKLTDVDTRRVGIIGGDVAEELGNATRKSVEDLLQAQEPRLLERARKTIRKNEDRLELDLNKLPTLFAPTKEDVKTPAPTPAS